MEPVQTRQRHWAIVGAGMLGMTMAHRLAQAGHRVTLFEAAPHVGGLASAWQLGDVTWDRHYHVTLLSDLHTRGIVAELGLGEEFDWVQTQTGFFVDGQLFSMSNSLEFLRFPPLRLVDKLRLGLTIFRASKIKDWRPLEQVPVAEWLRRWSGRRTFDKIWLPLLRAKLGENYQRTSAAFIWSTIARMYAARRSGMKKEMFGYVRGGYARVLERFAEMLAHEGVKLRLSTAIQSIRQNSGEPVVVTSESIGQPGVLEEQFDQVVLTVPAPSISRLCPQLSTDEHARLQGIEYQGIVCASVLLRRSLSRFYVTNITDADVPFTAVIEMSALVDRRFFEGQALVYLPKYVTADDATWQLSDAELRERFVAALERMYPEFDRQDVECFQVSRVRHVVALSTLDYSRHVPCRQTSLPGVQLVSSFQIVNGTLNVNETIRLAEHAAEELGRLYPAELPRANNTEPDGAATGECIAGSRQ